MVFYDAMLASNGEPLRAIQMFTAVFMFGPIIKENVCWGAACRSVATIEGAMIFPMPSMEEQLALNRWLFQNPNTTPETAIAYAKAAEYGKAATIRGNIVIRRSDLAEGIQQTIYRPEEEVAAPDNWRDW